MKHKQIKLRIEMMIRKDQQSIRGYNLIINNVKDVHKRKGYQSVLKRLKSSIGRKQEALLWIEANYLKDYN